jgi:hypothetical protein
VALVKAWQANAEAAGEAHQLRRWARHAPAAGLEAIIAALRHPAVAAHIEALADILGTLVSRHGPQLIDILEVEAANNPAFKSCLVLISSSPEARIPRTIRYRLSRAAASPITEAGTHMEKLFEDIPDLAQILAFEPTPFSPAEVAALTAEDFTRVADAWIRHEETFWAWERVNEASLTADATTTWSMILSLADGAGEETLAGLGAGLVEDLLVTHGPAIIGAIEAAAAGDQRLRFCISHAWPSQMDPAVWIRLVAARQDEPQRG